MFEATSSFYYVDDGEEVYTHAVGATITNVGAHPISLGEIVCEFRSRYSPNEIASRKEGLDLITISRGEPKLAWVKLYCEPAKVEAVFVIDTTGRPVKPNRKEKKQLIAECARIWPPTTPSRRLARLLEILRKLRCTRGKF
ncbi:MAG TPA: hypothetical protein VIY49_22760 [Bryobacteraceae bacterium]